MGDTPLTLDIHTRVFDQGEGTWLFVQWVHDAETGKPIDVVVTLHDADNNIRQLVDIEEQLDAVIAEAKPEQAKAMFTPAERE